MDKEILDLLNPMTVLFHVFHFQKIERLIVLATLRHNNDK